MKARLLLYMGMITGLAGRTASAGPWNIEPVVGLSSEFQTNPLLREFGAESEDRAAALLDIPVRFDGDAVVFSVRPYGRLTNSPGYASLASNYAHLDSTAQFLNELGSTTVQASLARDSSLYYAGALVYGVGVGRTTESATGDWNRLFTERSQMALDVSWTKVRYDQPSGLSDGALNIVDYRYVSGGPTYSYSVNERDTFKILGNMGQYQSLSGITASRSESLQLGYTHQLTEVWTASINAGYTKSRNSEKILNQLEYLFYGVIEYNTESANQNGTVYSATLTRQGERLNLSVGASRALLPTGLAFLSKQDSINLSATYKRSDRWDFATGISWQKGVQPHANAGVVQLTGSESAVRYLNAQIAVNWHWTPEWVVTLQTTRVTQAYGPPAISAASTGLDLDITRHFLRTEL